MLMSERSGWSSPTASMCSWTDVFRWNPSIGYEAFSGFFGFLRENPGGGFSARLGLRTPDGTIRYFTTDGRLRAIVDRNDNRIEFFYDDNRRLSYVLDTMGRRIDFFHDTSGRLTAVQDFTGRSVEYVYGTSGRLVEVRSPLVSRSDGAPQERLTATYEYLRLMS